MTPYEDAEDLRRRPPQQVLDGSVRPHISVPAASISGRTSIGEKRVLGQRAAISVARSTLSHSTIR
jgi:hypothetical protein